jgi:hypothetical protein
MAMVAWWWAIHLQPWQAPTRTVLPLRWPSTVLEQDLATVEQWGSLTTCIVARWRPMHTTKLSSPANRWREMGLHLHGRS